MKNGNVVVRKGQEANPTAERGIVVSVYADRFHRGGYWARVVWGPDSNADSTKYHEADLVVLPDPQDAASQLSSPAPAVPDIDEGSRVLLDIWSSEFRRFGGRPVKKEVAGTVLHRFDHELVIWLDTELLDYGLRPGKPRFIVTRLVDDVEREPVKPRILRPGDLLSGRAVELTDAVANALAEKGLYP